MVPVKKKGSYYIQSALYALCNFDIALLPIKLNLPMVCKPKDWAKTCDTPRSMSDLEGGYLSDLNGNISRYRLLSSNNTTNFNIDLEGEEYMRLCIIMNKLQGQPFQINSLWLHYINDNYSKFVDKGLLMPKFLYNVNQKEISKLLRDFYMTNEIYKKYFNFNNLLQDLHKDVQRAHYENFVLKLANAYVGYKFYLPVFLDFRGRIYRSGFINYHERDLARSLIVFADTEYNSELPLNVLTDNFNISTAFHYKSFTKYDNALDWLEAYKKLHIDTMFTLNCKHPFQFLCNINCSLRDKKASIYHLPITQDASASAYQIMSYLLLDNKIAKLTNLISSYGDDTISDIYSYILNELKDFIISDKKIDNNLSLIVFDKLDDRERHLYAYNLW